MGIINIWPFRKDSHAQFEKLVSPHFNNLYKLAYRLTGQRDNAEDLVQDLLLKIYPRLEEMQGIDKLAAWLSRVLYRLFIDQYRQQQRQPIQEHAEVAMAKEHKSSIRSTFLDLWAKMCHSVSQLPNQLFTRSYPAYYLKNAFA